jgi:PAS domain S-box-containing protein
LLKEGVIIFWNPSAQRVFGFARAEAIERWRDILSPHVCGSAIGTNYRQVKETPLHGDVLAVTGTAKNSRQLSLEFTTFPLRDGSRELIGLATIMRDVTERFEETRALKRRLSKTAN